MPRVNKSIKTRKPRRKSPASAASSGETFNLAEQTLQALRELFASSAEIGVDEVGAGESLGKYGLDSLLITRLNQRLADVIDDPPATLFFEYRTLSEVCDYLLANHEQSCVSWVGSNASVVSEKPDTSAAKSKPASRRARAHRSTRVVQTDNRSDDERFAIIGMAGRYPTAETLDEYWERLKAGKDCISEIPPDRWPLDGFYVADAQQATARGMSYSKWGSFLEGFADFDPLFFNISPREAAKMDPQERLFLQSAWEVLEDAGYTSESLNAKYGGRVGVFAGITRSGFNLYGRSWEENGEPFNPYTSFASVANRVSYVLNFRGPSVPVDTMCSASLTAIHEACEHIRMGACELAIAGGVNLCIHPSIHVRLSSLHMLSSDGRCKAFGAGGNGYVPGEGVGTVLIKRLSAAIADRDHIYAVILGTNINHGGKTSGYTVPNPHAQQDLIRGALAKAGIDARTISYVEAHGTGTELGDPIEVAGLTKAFQQDTDDTQFCALGSVKSNIGHLEAAAGIAGLTKVILQMQHGRLVPSLHTEELNPNINFAQTPFVVQRELGDWNHPVVTIDGRTEEYPRRAGVSSFGAGGANAHVILEEYIPDEAAPENLESPSQPVVVLLSARNAEQLRVVAARLLRAVTDRRFRDSDLWDLAYTLQVGREAMEVRLALTVVSIEELHTKLSQYLEGEKSISGVHHGDTRRKKEALSIWTADDDLQLAIEAWIEKGKYTKLAELWVLGYAVEWERVWGERRGRRVSLPTYPFARERYWIPAGERKEKGSGSWLHPLLEENTSDLSEQRYSSRFSGGEFFLRDHVVRGERVLPGVAYLEMARAAVTRAAQVEEREVVLREVVWLRPLVVDSEGVQVHISLEAEASGEISFEIYSEGAGEEVRIHSQGRAQLAGVGERPRHDLAVLRGGCAEQHEAEECYEALAQMGLAYGPGQRGLAGLGVGHNEAGESYVLGRLQLPESVGTDGEYELHPSVVDSALQAIVGFGLSEETVKAALPFALEQCELFAASPEQGVVYVRRREESAGERVEKYDLDLCDEQGQVCVRLRGLTNRLLAAEQEEGTGTLLLQREWVAQAVGVSERAEYQQHWIMLAGEYRESEAALRAVAGPGVRVEVLDAAGAGMTEQLAGNGVQLLERVQEILGRRPPGRVLVQLVAPWNAEKVGWRSALGGLLKSGQQENPQLQGQVLELERGEQGAGLVQKVLENAGVRGAEEVRYQDGVRYVVRWRELAPRERPSKPWRDGGVYLITGGAGGLGRIFAAEMLTGARETRVILAGRSRLNEAELGKLQQLAANGGSIEYLELDVTDGAAVQAAVQEIQRRYGSLQGVLHGAGVLQDSFLLKKTGAELRKVLAPKTVGVVNLDEATRGVRLDWFILFSSATGVLGNVGQSDYAMANQFLDRYAEARAEHVAAGEGERFGRTLSLNWPLWAAGGMQVDEASQAQLRGRGTKPLTTEAGVAAFYEAYGSEAVQVLVLGGERERLRRLMGLESAESVEPSVVVVQEPEQRAVTAVSAPELVSESVSEWRGRNEEQLREQTEEYLKQLLATTLKLPAAQLEAEAALEQYGIDSILALQMVNALEQVFGPLSKTLFFEYENIAGLARYFLSGHGAQLQELLGWQEQRPEQQQEQSKESATPPSAPVTRRVKQTRRLAREPQPPAAPQPAAAEPQREEAKPEPEGRGRALEIAIIGVSGRYPQAQDLQQYWENLKAGKDCITEVPRSRWDHRLYFDADKETTAAGKSYSKWGGFIEGVDQFDPLFFNISPREAERMDPQARLFLQCAYETLEDAGYTSAGTGGRVGVFVGVMYEEYQLYGAQAQALGVPYAVSGNPASIANRVSYYCNFHGPSMVVDTMCSSSLTSLHLACRSLAQGECELALAGGVNVSIHPNKYLVLAQGRFASSIGRCESFGEGGDGYVPGEGVGAVLLKPLRQAKADGDHIYGVIKGSALNHGGKTNGYTVPNPKAQAEVIREALQESGIDARTISYIEAHGTGTSLGDPIEIAGLVQAFAAEEKQYCAIGSVKSNIGHCESAAGIAGLTKVLLQLKHQTLVPSLHAEVLNPHIDFGSSPFVVQRELGRWRRPTMVVDGVEREYPRIAGLSSFGAGGSNAHVIIEEYEAEARAEVSWPLPVVVVLSAKNEERLQEQVAQLLQAIENEADEQLADLAYTLQVGREAMEVRLGCLVSTMDQLRTKLRSYLAGEQNIEEFYRGELKANKSALSGLAADEDLPQLLDTWIAKGKLTKLVKLWVKGLAVDWSRLYDHLKPRRLSLPTYPFAKERYWVNTDTLQSVLAGGDSLKTSKDESEKDEAIGRSKRILTKQWQVSPLVAEESSPQDIVILSTPDTATLAHGLVQRLAGSRVLILDAEQSSTPTTDFWRTCKGWIDLTGCGQSGSNGIEWIAWLQTCLEVGPKDLMALCVTRGLEEYQNSTIRPGGATRVGLYRMLPSEYARLRARHVDVDPSSSDATIIDQIAVEFFARNNEDVEICYRQRARYRSALEENVIADGRQKEPSIFPVDHVLWITGGTRGLGYLCAQHFVRNYGVKRLVLTGREVLPPRAQWNDYQAKENSVAQKIRAIQALEAEGAHVQVLSVSLTDETALRQSVQEIKETLGPIGGVIHCAGVFNKENPAFLRKSIAGMQQTFAPKVTGLDNLVTCFATEPLQFFLLFSSVSAIVPSLAVGQSDYASANAYMDYVAMANAYKLPIVSLQWPSWKETGIGEARSSVYQRLGFLSHTNAEGLRLLDYVLANKPGAVVLPAIVDSSRWHPDSLMRQRFEEVRQPTTSERLPVSRSAQMAEQPLAAMHSWIVSLVAEELRMEPSQVAIDTPLLDYGVDSVMLVQLLRRISERVGEQLDPSLFFEYPTIESFTNWLTSTHGDVVSQDKSETSSYTPQTVSAPPDASRMDIAVVGLSCRFPGARNVEEYWQLLSQGRTAIQAVPDERWGRPTGYYAGLLEDVAHFDPAFFNISEADAQAMDPQALLLLEESLNLWHQAGYSPQEIKGQAIGVYLGARSQHRPSAEILHAARNPILAVGQNYLASNISRFFDLHGPSLVVDTACSSALVAMQLAIQALRSGEITAALVGGVSLLNISALEIFEDRGILNRGPDFHVFDRRAQGALLGEGVGMVCLKSVDQALSDGDRIYAVVKSLAINNDGHIAGPTAPNLQAQKEVMQTALKRSGKQPEQIDYIEVNGSGSEVTDLIELKAIESVYRGSSTAPCELGSMKPNIGHPLCAEGIAGFIKVVLMLHHRQSVPFLSAREPMTHYDLAASPFYFSRGSDAPQHAPTIAAINCFADGGTNAHLILEASPEQESETAQRQPIRPPVLQKINLYSRPEAVGTNGNGSSAMCFWEQFAESNAVATHDNGVEQL